MSAAGHTTLDALPGNLLICATCGLVEHQTIPEDEAHCPCLGVIGCDCDCHGGPVIISSNPTRHEPYRGPHHLPLDGATHSLSVHCWCKPERRASGVFHNADPEAPALPTAFLQTYTAFNPTEP